MDRIGSFLCKKWLLFTLTCILIVGFIILIVIGSILFGSTIGPKDIIGELFSVSEF